MARQTRTLPAAVPSTRTTADSAHQRGNASTPAAAVAAVALTSADATDADAVAAVLEAAVSSDSLVPPKVSVKSKPLSAWNESVAVAALLAVGAGCR